VITKPGVPYLLLDGAPREGLAIKRVTSIREFAESFPAAYQAQEEDYLLVHFLFSNGSAVALDVIHGPEQGGASG